MIKEKTLEIIKIPRVWWRLLDSNQWPHACEDSIGLPSDGFWKNKAGLPRDFITRRYSPFHRIRPGFSVRGSRRGSTGHFRSCSHVTFAITGINKTFLEKVIVFRKIQGLIPRERETELGL